MKMRIKVLGAVVAAGVSLTLMLFLLGVSPAVAAPQTQDGVAFPDPAEALQAAIDWLVGTHQNSDGGYTSFSFGADQAPSDIGGTVDALMAIGSAGSDPFSPVNYLLENVEGLVDYAGQDGSTAGKTVLALSAAGEDPADFGGEDFVLMLTGHISPTGQYKVNTAFNQSLAMLGVAAAGERVPDIAAEWLLSLQAVEGDLAGSWDDGFGTAGNSDSTAISIMALLTSGQDGGPEAVTAGMDFLSRTQLPSGGWEYGLGFGENANSTALVLQTLMATGQDLSSTESPWLHQEQSPQAALLSWQGESGAFQADFGEGAFDDFFSTVQSAPALFFLPAAVPEPSPVPVEEAEPTVMAEPTAEPTETPLPPTTEPTVAPEPTAVEAPVETAGEPAADDEATAGETTAESTVDESDSDTWLFVVIGIVVIGLVVAAVFYLLKGRD